MGIVNSTGYSADVRLWLQCGERMIPLSHAASKFVIAVDPIDLPPGNATIIVKVDRKRFTRAVEMVDGMRSGSRETAIRPHRSVAPF